MSVKLNLNRNQLNLSRSVIDYSFLVFLILIMQGSISLKIIGIVIISTVRFRANLYGHYFILFYFFIIIFHLLYGGYLLFFNTIFYFPNYLLSLVFWIICYTTLCQIVYFTKVNSLLRIYRTIDLFFIINSIIIAYQLIDMMLLYSSVNPYAVTNSAGDYIKSLYSNSSVNFIIMSFFSVFYLQRKKWKYGFVAVIFMLMTTFMSGLVIFLGAMIIGVYFFSRIKIKNKLLIVVWVMLFFLVFNYLAPSNVTYASRYINRIVENGDDLPYKIKSFYMTLEYWTSSAKNFIFGAGGGNFSSRVAFITSGDYVGWFPDTFTHVSEEFKEYHLSVWNYDFNNPWDNRNNTANQPFSFYNQIIGEYGLIGILIFINFYLGFIIKKWKVIAYSKFLLLALAGYFLLDYWFEYFSVMVFFELLLLIDIQCNSLKISNYATK